ncbi:hypothetical protein INR49_023480 [Caranx melampygus]|nr:hypothetical protein INR49_014034 [Caranx melampygus]KAG7242392.1 hypothetical protein INR49_023480 [Caranx melampygus]
MFICPVVGLEMNGKHRFCYLHTCGCVFSDRALKEVKTEICHKVSGISSCLSLSFLFSYPLCSRSLYQLRR